MKRRLVLVAFLGLLCAAGCYAQEDPVDDEPEDLPTVEEDLGASREAARTDAEAVERCACLEIPFGYAVLR